MIVTDCGCFVRTEKQEGKSKIIKKTESFNLLVKDQQAYETKDRNIKGAF